MGRGGHDGRAEVGQGRAGQGRMVGKVNQWPISPKINCRPRLYFVLKTDGGIEKLTRKNYRRPKNNHSRRFIFGETGLWYGDTI